jgi:aspartate-semialdehyde dehydrogenase
MNDKIPVGILGTTGSVGQKFIELLTDHPWFELKELGASEKSANKKYSEAVNWVMQTTLPKVYGDMLIKNCVPDFKSRLLFSALDASVAGEIEEEFAKEGYIVVSNARNHRFDDDVPLMIPEVNPDHLALIDKQSYKGAIVTNPNCSTIGLALALKPIHDKFGIEKVNVVTMQAVSGSGYPGMSSMDMIDNVVPFIGGEEAKMETEPAKIFGNLSSSGKINPAEFLISAQCNRVPVIDGHLECVQVKFKKKPTKQELIDAWETFSNEPQLLKLPSAPKRPVKYVYDEKHPQPKLHRNEGNGMTVTVGRLRECSLFDYKFVVLSHNTVRGAAGGTILNAELMKAKGFLDKIL